MVVVGEHRMYGPRLPETTEPDPQTIISNIYRVLGTGKAPTNHEGDVARHMKCLARDATEFLSLAEDYDCTNKKKSLMEAIANNRAYESLMKDKRKYGVLEEKDEKLLEDLEHFFQLNFPHRGKYLAQCLETERRLGLLDPSQADLERAAQREEAKRAKARAQELADFREKSRAYNWPKEFMESYVPLGGTSAPPTKNRHTAAAGLATEQRNLKRSAEDREASLAGFASNLQLLKERRLGRAAPRAAAAAAGTWDSQEVSVEDRTAYYKSTRYARLRAARQAVYDDDDDDDDDEPNEEVFFEHQAIFARGDTNDSEPQSTITDRRAPRRRRVAA